VLETGATNGGIKMTGNEKIVLRPADDLDGCVVCVVAFEYAHVVVSNHTPTLKKSTY
jgi:hypothetical protein